MRRNGLMVMCVAVLVMIPNFVFADCVTLRNFSSFSVEEGYKVTLYDGQSPFAKFELQDCDVQSDSKIRFIKSYVCDGDEIEIDGSKCPMLGVKPVN